jgi:hypothetical protein
MQVPANRIADLLRVPGVVAVQADTPEQPQTDTTPEFLGATDVWPTLGGQNNAGDNVLVGVIDTGVWPEHPSYADPDRPTPRTSAASSVTAPTAARRPFACNDKPSAPTP